jgi:lactoylglutathione lyase
MYYIHTTVFTEDLKRSEEFWSTLGLDIVRRIDQPRFTATFMAAGRDMNTARSERFSPTVALVERKNKVASDFIGISHACYRVDDIYATCQMLIDRGMTLKMPPRDGFRAMVRDPDGAVIEFHQAGERKVPAEPWLSMPDGA